MRHYLDWNATAPLRDEARAALLAALAAGGNPSSVHREGRAARRLVETARAQVAALVEAEPDRVVFTSGGTEANNLAILGQRPKRILLSGIEHEAVLAAAHSSGAEVRLVRATAAGQIDLEHLAALLGEGGAGTLVALMLANNETGAIQPVAAAAHLAVAAGARLHCDAVQALGKIPVSVAALGAHTVALSAHKIGGPVGAGALVVDPAIDLTPLLRGGGQERGLRPGTENVAAVAGFGAAAAAQSAADWAGVADRRDRLQQALVAVGGVAYAAAGPRLPNTLCIGMPGVAAETQVMALDLAGIAVSAGAACSSGKLRPSQVLVAMGMGEGAARESIRFSLGWNTPDAAIEAATEEWLRLRARTARAAA